MTGLKLADAVYMGAAEVTQACLGAFPVWAKAPTAPTTGWFGTKSPGTSSASGDSDRAFMDRFAIAEAGTATALFLYFLPSTTAGCSIKALIYTDSAAVPGTLVAAGTAAAIPAGGGWVSSAITASLSPGNYWIGAVHNSYEANIGFVSSGSAPATRRIEGPGRGGTFSYASPPTTAPSGSEIYSGLDLPCYVEYTIP